jgi:hypothetical protein
VNVHTKLVLLILKTKYIPFDMKIIKTYQEICDKPERKLMQESHKSKVFICSEFFIEHLKNIFLEKYNENYANMISSQLFYLIALNFSRILT